jgi:HSP20 family molecular chaperone IbpA
MSLTRSLLNDFRPLFRLLEEPLHAPNFTRLRHNAWQPLVVQRQTPVEFSEEGDEVVVRAEVPGVQKEHLDVRLGNDGQSLTIEGRVRRASQARVEESTGTTTNVNAPEAAASGELLSSCNQRRLLTVSL